VHLVSMVGGSPAWALAECAKGRMTYTNLWRTSHVTQPYDLAAAVQLVRQAGGDVIGRDGQPIDALQHRGVLVASLSPTARERVLELVVASVPAD